MDRDEQSDEESQLRKRGSRADSSSEDEDKPSTKWSKTIDTSKFPWAQKWTTVLAALLVYIWDTYWQLDNFVVDPTSVISNILSTPGCPPFPPSKWLNLVRWKTLERCLTQPTLLNSTPIGPTSLMTRLSLPSECECQSHLLESRQVNSVQHQLFHAMEVRLHSRVIEFDRSMWNQMVMQRNLHLTDYSQFKHLWMTFLTSFDIGSNSAASTSGTGGRVN